MTADTARVREFFDRETYLARNPILPIRVRLVGELLGDLCGARVLDLGCGDGSISRPLLEAGNDVTFVDFSAAMLERARTSAAAAAGGTATYVQADALEWEPQVPYDAVLCIGLLAHVRSVEKLVERVAAATRPGGRCIVQLTDASRPVPWLLTRYARIRRREGYRLNELTRWQLISIAAPYGLVPIETRRYALTIPGTRFLPFPLRLKLEERASRGRLSQAGVELLLMFEKEPQLR